VSSFPLRPRDIFEEIRKSVVGQDDAVRELAVALVKHLVGQPAPNILLIGNSGSGKTTIMRAIEEYLTTHAELGDVANVIRMNANVLAEEHSGYARSVLGRLYQNARAKLLKKNLDMIAANEVGDTKVFECEDNHLIVLSRTARHDLGQASKAALAERLIDLIVEALKERETTAQRGTVTARA